MKRILVTGATGLVGREVVPLLASRGFEVHAVSRRVHELGSGITSHGVDLLQPGAARALATRVRATHLLHLAWHTDPSTFWHSLENLSWTVATLELVSAFCDAGGTRFVGAGTCAEYDWSYGYCVENQTPIKPRSLYGAAKNAVRQLAEAYFEQRQLGMAWARIFFVYGPGEPRSKLVSTAISGLLSGAAIECTQGRQIRDYVHVQDVAGALAALVASDVSGPVNIASGVPTSVRDLIMAICDLAGAHHLVRFGAKPERPDDPPLLVADVTRLRDQVGYPIRLDLAAGLAQAFQWHRDHTTPT